MIDTKSYKKFWEDLQKNDNYLITTHINPDADGLCSAIAMGMILKKLKKKYYIIIQESFPKKLRFLIPEYADYVIPEVIQIPETKDLFKQLPEQFTPETVLILDTCGNDRIGKYSKHFSKIKVKLNIDHHSGQRKFPGKNDLITTKASATGEIIFNLMKHNNFKITKTAAKLLYMSIISDTRNFSQANTTNETHAITAKLLKTGLKPEKINYYFQIIQSNTLKIYGQVISRLKTEFKEKLIWSYITKKELEQCINGDVDGLIEILRNAEKTEAALLIKETKDKKVKCSMRGKNGFDVYTIAKSFNGGGHKQAAGFNIDKNLKTSQSYLIKHLKKYF